MEYLTRTTSLTRAAVESRDQTSAAVSARTDMQFLCNSGVLYNRYRVCSPSSFLFAGPSVVSLSSRDRVGFLSLSPQFRPQELTMSIPL